MALASVCFQVLVVRHCRADSPASCRIGTTVATNALLEQKGERFALATTKGLNHVPFLRFG